MTTGIVTRLALASLLVVVVGCGKNDSAGEGSGTTGARKVVEEKVPPYTYKAPVSGHYKEVNEGEFDVVDGVAYAASKGGGTVVYVTSKPIASPVIADSACPMTDARALSELRDVHYLEVTLNNKGQSDYFAAGSMFNGSSKEGSAGHPWSSRMTPDPARAIGSVDHRRNGNFSFDLPLSAPKFYQNSEADNSDGKRGDPGAPKPTEQAVTAAYRAIHDAALKKNLKALLAAQGFSPQQITAIRGLDGIDADLAVYADRFLTPGTPGEFTPRAGTGYVRAEGVNSAGKKFVNFYHFTSCGDRLVLTAIAINPQ